MRRCERTKGEKEEFNLPFPRYKCEVPSKYRQDGTQRGNLGLCSSRIDHNFLYTVKSIPAALERVSPPSFSHTFWSMGVIPCL